MSTYKPIIAFLLFLFSCNSHTTQELPEEISGKVIGIKDGDTIEIIYKEAPLIIRLAHIDCPEIKRGQPFGKAAKQFTSDLCFGKVVTVLNKNEFDSYDRLIGVIINPTDDTVNLELVKAGLAWHYKKYSSDILYSGTEAIAKEKKIGVWADNNPIAPWDWR